MRSARQKLVTRNLPACGRVRCERVQFVPGDFVFRPIAPLFLLTNAIPMQLFTLGHVKVEFLDTPSSPITANRKVLRPIKLEAKYEN